MSNDVAVLDELFRADPRTHALRHRRKSLRLRRHHGVPRRAFAGRRSVRTTAKTVITTYGRDFAVASTLFYRVPGAAAGSGGRCRPGCGFPEGWRMVAAHVSLMRADRRTRVKAMSLDDLPGSAVPRPEPDGGPARRPRVLPDKITLAEELRLQLADEIVRGALAPGHGARRDRPRAALQCLAHAGARGDPATRGQRPGRCARASRRRGGAALDDRLIGMFEAMGEIEALCAGLAAERMTGRRSASALEADPRAIAAADPGRRSRPLSRGQRSAFTTRSMPARRMPIIAEMTMATRVRVQPFRRAQFRNLGRLAKSYAEHDRVVVAIMRGDKRTALRPRCAPISNCARGIRALRGVGVGSLIRHREAKR